ncbi:MAG TPA: DUF5658 family protein [Gammaproteobacteria bacterium]|nr:DUF5658 family protein [Gammaproteobacteria bacterium]
MQTEQKTDISRRRLIDQLLGRPVPAGPKERREQPVDRRNVTAASLLRGSFRPRRRGVRRESDVGPQYLDWHPSGLLFAVVGILMLCALDAFLTLKLLHLGAEELNPLMKQLIEENLQLFAAAKMALTGAGIVLFVLHANARLFSLFRVSRLLYVLLCGYSGLIVYELDLLGYL